jgi:peptide chain release factor 1
MFDKLAAVEKRYDELMTRLGTVEVQSDAAEYRKAAKALAELEPLVQKYREYMTVEADLAGTTDLAKGSDAEIRALAEEELPGLQAKRDTLLAELKILLIPKDPNDEKNVILEIRAGTGGDEAGLFAAELFRMYTRYAETQRWKIDVMSSSEGTGGGIKEVIASIEGKGVYSHLKYESGVHRVQRGHSGGATRSRGRGHQDRGKGSSHRHVLLERSRRPERQHDLLRGAAHAHPHRRRRVAAGREVADQESRKGDEGTAGASL